MTLGDLLTILRTGVLNDRSDRTAGSSDYLWTDETLVRYIDEAQRKLCVQGLVLRDGTTDAVTKVTLVAGQTNYTLHPAVIAVISAKRADQTADLNRVGHAVLAGHTAPSDNWVDPAGLTQLPPGVPLAYSTDEGFSDTGSDSFEQVVLRVYPTPSAAEAGQVVRLRVLRKPIERLSHLNLGATPEVPEDHHIEMLDYAAYLALRIVDDDGGAPGRALEFLNIFTANVREARRLAMRKLFAPTPWGFGRGGFTWSS